METLELPSMPDAETYEREYEYWPWGDLIRTVAAWIASNAERKAVVLDYMCGTGYLLNLVRGLRPDLKLEGCSLEPREYIEYGRERYQLTDISYDDALTYTPQSSPSVVVCTAGIHHLPRHLHKKFIEKVASELSTGAVFVIGESLIEGYESETERRLNAFALGAALIKYAIEANSSDDLVSAAVSIMENDILERGEYKLSLQEIESIVEPWFEVEERVHTWPATCTSDIGDYILICRRR